MVGLVMVTGKLSVEGSAALLAQGVTEREKQFRSMVEAQGGQLRGYWYTDLGEAIVLIDLPDGYPRATAVLQSMASGAWSDVRMQELYGPQDIDAGNADLPEYTPPGS